MRKVKWGVLGTADIARGQTIPGMQLAEHCELYAIAGRKPEKAQSYKEQFGFRKAYGSYDELLADPEVEAVYIPLPNNIHCEWARKALQAKKHVLCEKPLAVSAAQAEEMFRTAEENGVMLMEAFAYLHSPFVKAVKEELDAGTIGEILYFESEFIAGRRPDTDIRLKKETGGGAFYDLGCYCTTMILTLVDAEPEFVKAVAEFTDLGVDANTAGIIRFDNGVRASFNVGMILGKNTNARFDRLYIHGTKGAIHSDVEYNQEGDLTYRIVTPEGTNERAVHVPHNYALEIEQLSRCILYGEKPHITPAFSVRNAELMDKVLQEIGY